MSEVLQAILSFLRDTSLGNTLFTGFVLITVVFAITLFAGWFAATFVFERDPDDIETSSGLNLKSVSTGQAEDSGGGMTV